MDAITQKCPRCGRVLEVWLRGTEALICPQCRDTCIPCPEHKMVSTERRTLFKLGYYLKGDPRLGDDELQVYSEAFERIAKELHVCLATIKKKAKTLYPDRWGQRYVLLTPEEEQAVREFVAANVKHYNLKRNQTDGGSNT